MNDELKTRMNASELARSGVMSLSNPSQGLPQRVRAGFCAAFVTYVRF